MITQIEYLPWKDGRDISGVREGSTHLGAHEIHAKCYWSDIWGRYLHLFGSLHSPQPADQSWEGGHCCPQEGGSRFSLVTLRRAAWRRSAVAGL